MYKVDKVQKESRRIETIGRVISGLIYIILIPLIIFNFTLIIKSFINPKETPDFFGLKSFVIVSRSMEPTINKGDAILVKEVPESEIAVNDIVSFSQDGTNVTHRIVDVTQEDGKKQYTTKGDNNNTEDKEKITYEQIEGKYQFRIKKFGVFVSIIKSKFTLILLIVIIVVMYCHNNKRKEKSKMRKQKRENYNKDIQN